MAAPPKLMGVILAGGRSTRMGGGDKGLLPLGGKPVIAHVIARLHPQLPDLIINANGDPARFQPFGLPVVGDRIPGFKGPLAGLHATMRYAAGKGASHVVTTAADTPFLPPDLVSRLVTAAEVADIVLAASGGNVHPVAGLWPVALEADLAAFLNSGEKPGMRAWASRYRVAEADFPDNANAFFNINTPQDLARAAELLAKLKS
ncbi:molybdenum cofactor guanylyltransferase [Brucella endophytica]|uniref:Molybdenum cofactor guanylyltransferase n=1 Tax=Brucella endophytica TaxID=1963359 RepID=A0A916SBT1_9HYPH|nr:molybdenum cofactor guanylyltransferase MobA [Brucella endophytica]GGA92750.1 molybdenum cofactor guanylyltransferase [Brucella endophytica]